MSPVADAPARDHVRLVELPLLCSGEALRRLWTRVHSDERRISTERIVR